MFNWTHLFCVCVGVLVAAFLFSCCYRVDKR